MRKLAAASAFFSSFAGASFGQLTRGFVSGTVQDTSGARIEGVRIVATNNDTKVRRETITNVLGVYRAVALEPGIYSIEYTKPGFETRRVPRFQVGTNQEVVLNQVLGVAANVTTVEIVEAPPGVELAKSSASLDRKIEQRFVEIVPLTGATRDVTRLAIMAPTVVRSFASSEISANGQRARNNNFTIDGVDNNDLSVTVAGTRIIPEAVAEFQVQTAAYSAEYGRNSGAHIAVITKSGTNAFHGEVFDYYRANWMEPVSLLNERAGLRATPRFVHNQAGGDLGGPIRRERTFFFGIIEANRRREAPDAGNATRITIPTPDGYTALSQVRLGDGQSAGSRQAVLGALNFLPAIHKQIPRYDSLANVNINGTPVQVGTVRIPLANPSDYWYAQGRVDHQLRDGDQLSYRVQIDKRNQADVVSNLGFGQLFSGDQASLASNHALSEIHTFNERFINEFRMGFARRNLDFPERDERSTVNVGTDFFIGGASTLPQGRISNTFQWQDVATYMPGRHSLKFGADIRRNRLFNRSGFDAKGTWTFISLAEFINNKAFSLLQAVNEATFDSRQTNQYYFLQDDVKVTKDLTINLGMRYEYSGVPFGFFGAANAQIAAVGVPGMTRPDKNNWAPRFGLAYSPSGSKGPLGRLLGGGQTVFRGGYGITYDVLFYNILSVNASNYPRVVVDRTDPPATDNLFPNLKPKVSTVPPLNPLATFTNSPADLQNPTTHFWSFSIQRQINAKLVFEIGYSGNRNYHSLRQGQLNPGILTAAQAQTVISARNAGAIPPLQARRVNPAWGVRTTIESTAFSNYHAMFLRADKKLGHGLMFGANYTWSANFSDNDESLGVAAITNSVSQVPQDYFNYRKDYGRSAFDIPHRFVVHYIYDVPWFRGALVNGTVMRRIFKGWQLAGFSEWQSGQPFSIRTGVDSGGTGTTGPFRPDYNRGGTITLDPVDGTFRTFKTAFDGTGIVLTPLTPAGILLGNSMPGGGSLGKSVFRGPSYTNWNICVSKSIEITERLKLQLRSDWINTWNHRNFGIPNVFMNNLSAFGTNTSDPGGRTMLMSAKVRF